MSAENVSFVNVQKLMKSGLLLLFVFDFQVIVANPVDILSNCYSSHVLRRLLCLCKGVSLDSPEFHGTKSSAILAERLNLRASRANLNDMQTHGKEFPHLLKSLVLRMLKCSKMDIKTLLVDQYSSLVLQACFLFNATLWCLSVLRTLFPKEEMIFMWTL